MSDLPQQNTIIQYLSDGIEDEYIVPFYTPIETDGTPNLDVFTQLSTAAPVPETDIKTWNIDYIYTPYINFITGGVLKFLPGHIPPNGFVITIVRDISASLDVEFANASTFSGKTLDAALDKLLLIEQQNKSYTLERNISYIINSYLPESTIASNVQIPVLKENQTWFGSGNGVIAATLEQPANVSVLRSQLANADPITNGAGLVGFYDIVNEISTTVKDQLTLLTNSVFALFPSGTIIDFAGIDIPSGFLLCDGSEVSKITYSRLYEIIGTLWGTSTDPLLFKLPDFTRRVAMGSGGVGTSVIGNTVGNTCNDETASLTDPLQLPSHTHTASNIRSTFTYNAGQTPGGNLQSAFIVGQPTTFKNEKEITTTFTIDPTGQGNPFNITQASAIVLKLIKT